MKTNLIGGEWRGEASAPNVNPSDTSDIVGDFAIGDRANAQDAIAAARAAFVRWGHSEVAERHTILTAAARELAARADEIGRLLSREEGKILAEGVAEVRRAAQIFDFSPARRCGSTACAARRSDPGWKSR